MYSGAVQPPAVWRTHASSPPWYHVTPGGLPRSVPPTKVSLVSIGFVTGAGADHSAATTKALASEPIKDAGHDRLVAVGAGAVEQRRRAGQRCAGESTRRTVKHGLDEAGGKQRCDHVRGHARKLARR